MPWHRPPNNIVAHPIIDSEPLSRDVYMENDVFDPNGVELQRNEGNDPTKEVTSKRIRTKGKPFVMKRLFYDLFN